MLSSLANVPKYFLHHLARERIVARGHRRMSGKDIGRCDDLERGIKIEFLLDDVESDAFEREKRGVPFVHVKHFGFDPERVQRFHPADPEHDFLAHPHLQVAAIKLSGEQSILGAVLRECRYREDKG